MNLKAIFERFLLAITLIILLVMPGIVLATTTGEIYLSPASTSVTVSNQITLALRVNPATPIDTVQATVNFNSSYLSFVSDNSSGSPFTCLGDNVSSSSVSVTCYLTGSTVSSDSLIKNLTFSTLTTGSTNLSISGAETASAGTPYYPAVAGASVSINPAPTQTQNNPTPPKSTYYSPTITKTSSAQPTTQTVSPINLNLSFLTSSIYALKASVTINTTSPATFFIKYGLTSTNLNNQTSPTGPTKNPVIALDNLTPKTNYFYQVVAIDSNNQTQTSKISSFTTLGVSFTLQLLADNYQPLTSTRVFLDNNQTFQTSDQNGKVTFSNISPGNHQYYFYEKSKKISSQIYVPSIATGSVLAPQNQTVVLSNFKLTNGLIKPTTSINMVIFGAIVFLFSVLAIKFRIKK